MSEIPAPVPRIDADDLVDGVNKATDAGIRLTGSPGHGEVGAGFVEWPNGDRGVITRSGADLAELERARGMLARAEAAGIPVPAYRLIVDLGGHRAIVQARLPGDPPSSWSDRLGAELIALVERCRGLGSAQPGIDLYLRSSGPGYCEHETLTAYDDRSRRLLADIHEIGADSAAPEPGDDLVHLDFHTGNVLLDRDRVSGLVDWDGYGRGDRRLMLVTLLFDLCYARQFRAGFSGVTAESLAPMLALLHQAPPPAVRRWWAHMSLRQVDWTVRHRHPAEVVEHYLGFARRGLDRLLQNEPLHADELLTPLAGPIRTRTDNGHAK